MFLPWREFNFRSGRFDDLSRTQTPGANPDLADAPFCLRLHVLEVRLPLLHGSFVGMTDAVPENGPFPANFTNFGHV